MDFRIRKNIANDSSKINNSGYNFPRTLAEGMVQHFARGTQSSSEVNYGEYVLIDTIYRFHNTVDPDNGKIFRRGMNIDTELAGAEYIGQIVGPQGEVSELSIDHYRDIMEEPNRHHGSYNMIDGIVPGKIDGEDIYNDEIKYAYVTVYDEYDNITGATIGFEFPYFVEDFFTVLRSPYDEDGIPLKDDVNIIERVDDRTHPYYERWKLYIPRGIQGDDLSNLKIYPTKVRAGTPFWNDSTFSGDPAGYFSQEYNIVVANDNYLTILYNGRSVYCKPDDGWGLRIKYTVTSYKEQERGISQEIDIGKYDIVSGFNLADDGVLTIFYTNSPDKISDTVVKWIEPDNGGFEFLENGTIKITFNTGEQKIFEDLLTWMTDIDLSDEGDFVITYNNEKISHDGTNKDKWHLQWINRIAIDDRGNVDFIYNDGDIAGSYPGLIKVLKNIYVDTEGSQGIEGYGDQKIHIEYNTGIAKAVGRPLNYIIETVVTDNSYEGYGTKPYHLLVLYADPAKRSDLINPKTYHSEVLNKDMNDWADLGYVRGNPGGLHIIKEITNIAELYHDPEMTDPIKPEEIIPDEEMMGWAVTLHEETGNSEIMVFDYAKDIWYSIGSIDAAAVDATRIFVVSGIEPTNMVDGGVWAKLGSAIYAN